MPDYEIRVIGPVRVDVADRLGLEASVEPVASTLRGPVADDAALHGILARFALLDVDVVDVRPLP
jgi:hypothetical protein